jgi:hypothetical protein
VELLMRLISHIVLHTAASYDFKRKQVVHLSRAAIGRYHREQNGWRAIGYHWYIEEDGRGVQGRPDDDIGAHVGGFNSHSLGLCVSGHGDFASWDGPQWAEALRKCAQWCGLYRVPVEHVIGHREAGEHGAPATSKTCPGLLIDMDRFRRELGERLSACG